MFKRSALFIILGFLFAGCFGDKTDMLQTPKENYFSDINLPQSIEFNGEKFYKKYQNDTVAEYYLIGEEGYKWSKIVSVLHASYINNIDEYIKAIHLSHKENTLSKSHYEITKINDFQSVQKELYYPVKGNANFNAFEINYNLSTIQKCGIVSISFSQKFGASSDPKKLTQLLYANEKKFLKEAPRIECK